MWIEKRIEYQASLINGAKVEIDEFDLKLAWTRLQVANPENSMMNTFETSETEFDVQFWPLLWSKVIIEDMKMTGFRLETERETDGYFEIPVKEETGEPEEPGFLVKATREISSQIAANAQMEFVDVKDDINVDSLMAMVNLQSIDKMDSLQQGLNEDYTKWENTITNNALQKNTNDIKTTVNNIDINKIKDTKHAIAELDKIKKITKEADSLKKEVQSLKNGFQSDLTALRRSIGSIDEWVREDINRAESVAKLPELNAQNIGVALFGENLLGDFNKYLGYANTARKYGSRFIGSDEKVERYKGKNYEFSSKLQLARFLDKNH